MQRTRDLDGNVALHRKNVGQVAVVGVRPERFPGRRIHQLRGDPHPLPLDADGAVDQVLHAQFADDLRQLTFFVAGQRTAAEQTQR